jgi:hypothetical protein
MDFRSFPEIRVTANVNIRWFLLMLRQDDAKANRGSRLDALLQERRNYIQGE